MRSNPDTNRFDQIAATWDEAPTRVAMARAVASAIRERIPLTTAMDVLDYGCGTGLLTLALQPQTRHITGADTSAGMLAALEKKVAAAGLTAVTLTHLTADNAFGVSGTFDLIASSMTLHHVRDVQPLLARFRAQVRPGGWVALADLDHEDGTFHQPDVTDVYHLGFDRTEFQDWLEQAGFEDVEVATAFTRHRDGRDYPVFLATARVPQEGSASAAAR